MSATRTSLMFVTGSQPLAGARVRLAEDPTREWTTDDEGRIEVELERGEHAFELEESGSWRTQVIDTSSRSSLLVVNVSNTTDTLPRLERTTSGNFLARQLGALGERYSFEKVLGRGGMGVVIKAKDSVLDRTVAMKALSEELRDNQEAQHVFLSEARALATLKHPNLVSVHDVTTIDGIALMVFEFVEGTNLEDAMRDRERFEQSELVAIARQLAEALDYLHGSGVIHRDLKPANLIRKPDGTIKVIDFGLARSLEDIYSKGTRVRGTPAYMSPEQILGKDLGPSSDLYQYGTTLYELAAGELPFPAGDMSYAHVHMTPPLIEEKVPDMHPGLASLINRCLAKDPSERPESAKDIVALLEHIEWALSAPDPLTAEQLARVSGAHSALGVTHASRLTGAHLEPLAPAPSAPRSRAPLVVALLALVLVGAGIGAWVVSSSGQDPDAGVGVASLEKTEPAAPDEEPATVEPTAGEPDAPTPTPADETPEVEEGAAPAAVNAPPKADAAATPTKAGAPAPRKVVKPRAAPKTKAKPKAKPSAPAAPEPEVTPPAPEPEVVPPAPEPEPPAPEPEVTPEPEPEPEPKPVVVEKKPEPKPAEKKPEDTKTVEKKPEKKKPAKRSIPRSF